MGTSIVESAPNLSLYTEDVDWIKIEDLKGVLSQFEPVHLHPDDPQYKVQWNGLRTKLVDGIFYPQFGKMRYIPGRLGYYSKFCTIVDTKDKVRYEITPDIRDLEFHFAYYLIEALGFSGCTNDDKYTCDRRIHRFNKLKIDAQAELITSNGKLKEFREPREYLFSLHDDDLGQPLYKNDASNLLVLGARGGGKSYSFALMGVKYELTFHGARNSDRPIGKTSVEIGSGQVSKSSELIDKIVLSNECLKKEKFGAYGEEGDDDFEPCPFYMWMDGSYRVNNQQNPWIQQKTVKKGKSWKKIGRKSTLYHSSYSTNKKEGAEASAGGRRNMIVYEEIGLTALIKEVWGSNNAVVRTDSEQYGSQIGIGTSGNIELIQSTKHIFTHPKDYNCLIFGKGNGFFLPAPLTNKDFKDENGNTNLEEAYEYYIKRREEAKMASDPQVLIAERMNYPLSIEDMWLGGSSGYLPDKEAELREKELIANNLYENIGQAVELVWDSKVDSGVTYRIKPKSEAKPIYNWPLSPNDPTHGEIMIYIHPEKLKVNGLLPNDAVIFLHDPYVSDELDKGGSLGASYAIVNPKYESFGLPSYQIAATWISRHPHGVDAYNEEFEKLIQFYGNPVRNVWYEANRGDRFKGHITKKKKNYLLCLRPQFEQGQYIYTRNATQTGYVVSNQIAKVTLLDGLRDLLLMDVGGKLLIETIPCLFTIKQIRQFKMDGNFDGVSALQGLPLAIKEIEHYTSNRQQTGVLHSISKNLVKRLRPSYT